MDSKIKTIKDLLANKPERPKLVKDGEKGALKVDVVGFGQCNSFAQDAFTYLSVPAVGTAFKSVQKIEA